MAMRGLRSSRGPTRLGAVSSSSTIKGFAMYKLSCCVAMAGASVPLILVGSASGTLIGLNTVAELVVPAEIAADE